MEGFIPCSGRTLHQLCNRSTHISTLHTSPRWRVRRSSGASLGKRNRCTIITGRMRNKGGFQLPPLVPEEESRLRRAIELIGNYTQRRMTKQSTLDELETLVGALPPSREVAQQWKATLEKTAKAKNQSCEPQFKNRDAVLEKIYLPTEEGPTGRCFILLGCLQRRYRLNQPRSIRAMKELERKLGSCPQSEAEVHHYIRALKLLQKERRYSERKPSKIPTDMPSLFNAKMLLGTFEVRGSIGKQTERLRDLIGDVPRTRNVAASWKKLVAAAIRKKKRNERVALRQREIEHKRLIRRLRKERRALEQAIAAPQLDTFVDAHVDNHPKHIGGPLNLEEIDTSSPAISKFDSHEQTKTKMHAVLELLSKLFPR